MEVIGPSHTYNSPLWHAVLGERLIQGKKIMIGIRSPALPEERRSNLTGI